MRSVSVTVAMGEFHKLDNSYQNFFHHLHLLNNQQHPTWRIPSFIPPISWMPQPTISQPSPPPSPPSNNTTWAHNQQPNRHSSFTIEAILGTRPSSQRSPDHHKSANNSRNQDLRAASRHSPYPLPSEASVNTSGNASSGGGKASKAKRIRTIFTAEQLERLEREFSRQQYMVGPERICLARSLNLSEAQVKVWFQNRRIKWRKQYLDNRRSLSGNQPDNDDHDESRSPPSSPDHLEVASTDTSDGSIAAIHLTRTNSDENTPQDSKVSPSKSSPSRSHSPTSSESRSPSPTFEVSSTPIKENHHSSRIEEEKSDSNNTDNIRTNTDNVQTNSLPPVSEFNSFLNNNHNNVDNIQNRLLSVRDHFINAHLNLSS